MNRLAYNIATTFGLGDRLPAPGTTAGSFPAALVWFGVAWVLGDSAWLISMTTILIVLSVIAGFWAADLEIGRRGGGDPGPVVVDEVAGQWITYGIALPVWSMYPLWVVVLFTVAGFLLFRFFDILKPGPIRALEQLPGVLGVMADDLLAGVAAGVALIVVYLGIVYSAAVMGYPG